jgi:hypothetical protein
VIGLLGDLLRFWWALVYWNTRKSLFRRRPAGSRCPCQNPSDSGRAFETGCDAAYAWSRPARFRRVCPLLVEAKGVLRCSVDAREVRPFWLRAGAYYCGAAAAFWLLITLGVFLALRLIGYPLSPLTVAWPPRWPEVRVARSDYFVAKARGALAEHRVSEAILSLDAAYRDNPRNFAAGLQLAQLVSPGQPEFANHVFAALMRDFPGSRGETSKAWFTLLLIHGRFDELADLASARLLEDPRERPAWLHALFKATLLGGDDQPLRDLIAKHASQLDPIDVALINSELLIRQGHGAGLLPGLTAELPPSTGAYGPYFQVSHLEEMGLHAEALAVLNRYAAGHRIAEADELRFRLDILASLGRQDLLRERLAQSPVTAREIEIISIHLVRHPDPGTMTALDGCLQRSSVQIDASTYAAYTAFFVACGVTGDWDRMHGAAQHLRQAAGGNAARFDVIEAFFRQEPRPRIETILPLLPGLSLDLIYALYDRYGEPHPAASFPAAAER